MMNHPGLSYILLILPLRIKVNSFCTEQLNKTPVFVR